MWTNNSKDNELIAEFMGYEVLYRPNSNGFIELSETELCDVDDLQYHSDWNELMKVVDKIESFEDKNRCAKYNVNMLQCWVEIINNDTSEEIVEAEGINKLQATYKAVVEFIKFYNNQNK